MTEIANQNIDIEVVETGGETAQYFWNNTTDSGAGEGAGAHITEIPKEDFIDDPDAGGMNTLINTNGMAVRDGLTELGVFSAEQIRLGDFDGGNIVIVPTGLNINNANVQFATFDIEDGIMLKTQEGADALNIIGDGEVVYKNIRETLSSTKNVTITAQAGTKIVDVPFNYYPQGYDLTVRVSNLFPPQSTPTYRTVQVPYNANSDSVVEIGSYEVSSQNVSYALYLILKPSGRLYYRNVITNTSETEQRIPISNVRWIKFDYVKYTAEIHIPSISTDGHLYLYGHSTPVGDLKEASTSNYSNTYSSGSSSWVYPQGNSDYLDENGLLLPAGRWVVQATVQLQTLTAGSQYGVGVGYGDSRNTATMALASRNVVTAGSTSAVILNTTHLADASGSNRYYVGVYHSGKATVTYMSIKAMRVR